MNVLIIGGSGFVSGTLARTAVQAGHKTWIVTRGQRPAPPDVVGLLADRHDREAFRKVIVEAQTAWDLVVDCIGYDVSDARQDVEVFRPLARRLVFISTDFVFDPAGRTFPQGEQSDFYLSEGYGGKKRLCELELLGADTGEMAVTILRPCHIYGPGSKLGCLPAHGRDAELIDRIRRGEALKLVGGGHFLQQPILAGDLAELILSCAGNERAAGQIYNAAGPDIIESRQYYRIIADVLGAELRIEEVSVSKCLRDDPGMASFLCHRIYDLRKLREHGLAAPSTPIAEGLRRHVQSLLGAT